MTVLILSRGIPSKRDPQYGGFEWDQAKALVQQGHRVIMASVDNRFRLYWRKPGLRISEQDGIRTYSSFICPAALSGIFGKRLQESLIRRQWQAIEKAILRDEGKIDIIYAHYLFNAYAAVHYLTRIQVPVVAIEHWSELNREPLAPAVKLMAQTTYPHVARLLTVSTPLKERIASLFGIQATVVHNMIGTEFHYTPAPAHEPFTFVCVGSLLPVKNHTLLIAALEQAQLPAGQWQLILIGEGPEHARLQAQIDRAGLTDHIHLVGMKNKTQIAALLNDAHAFVLPSKSENFSVAVLEALACGLPVIASLCGGIRECIDDSNGLLFEVDDLTGLTRCIEQLFTRYPSYNRQAIADNCQSRFSAPVIAHQLTTIFNEVIG